MVVLSDVDILAFIESGEIAIDGFSKSFLEPASYDLRLGPDGIGQGGLVDIKGQGCVTVARGETVVVHSHEKVHLGLRVIARYGLPSALARQGLILLSGPQVDPGFNGVLGITFFNAGTRPVVIAHMDKIATIEFDQLRTAASRPYLGPYQDQKRFASSEFNFSKDKYKTFEDIEAELRELESKVRSTSVIVNTVFLGLIVGITLLLGDHFLSLDTPPSSTPTPTASQAPDLTRERGLNRGP